MVSIESERIEFGAKGFDNQPPPAEWSSRVSSCERALGTVKAAPPWTVVRAGAALTKAKSIFAR